MRSDMGGQDCKAIHCDEQGKVTDFLMNDKCAAGTGRGMEVMSEMLAVPIQDIGPLSLEVHENEVPPVSSTCVVFTKSEAMSLVRSGWSSSAVLAAYCQTMARRVVGLLGRIRMEPEFAITGGIAKNVGVVRKVEKDPGMEALPAPCDPQIVGALSGAPYSLWDCGRSTKRIGDKQAIANAELVHHYELSHMGKAIFPGR